MVVRNARQSGRTLQAQEDPGTQEDTTKGVSRQCETQPCAEPSQSQTTNPVLPRSQTCSSASHEREVVREVFASCAPSLGVGLKRCRPVDACDGGASDAGTGVAVQL